MSESVVSPTPVFMGQIGPDFGPRSAVSASTAAVALHTDVPGLILAGQAELRAQANAYAVVAQQHATNAAAAAAAQQLALSAFRTEMADRFSAQTISGLQAKIADGNQASLLAVLTAIASKVGATVVGA